MATPNIVNVSTITGITTWKAGINTEGAGVTVILANAAASSKVLKVNSLTAAGIGASVDVTVKILNQAAGAGSSVAIGKTITVPNKSTLQFIDKSSSIYLQEDQSLTAFHTYSAEGSVDVVCSYEEIS